MNATARTATQLLLEVRLGRDLEEYVRELRSNEQSWRQIAEAIYSRTGINVSHETVRGWFAQASWSSGDAA
ncbi:MAG TPA: hypothetical protein VIV12_02095 [Streptosporangiaceae bacterium]